MRVLVLANDGRKLMECIAVMVEERKDRNNLNEVFDYVLRGITPNGRKEILAHYSDKETAYKELDRLTDSFKAVRV